MIQMTQAIKSSRPTEHQRTEIQAIAEDFHKVGKPWKVTKILDAVLESKEEHHRNIGNNVAIGLLALSSTLSIGSNLAFGAPICPPGAGGQPSVVCGASLVSLLAVTFGLAGALTSIKAITLSQDSYAGMKQRLTEQYARDFLRPRGEDKTAPNPMVRFCQLSTEDQQKIRQEIAEAREIERQ